MPRSKGCHIERVFCVPLHAVSGISPVSDTLTSAQRSYCMSQIRGYDTGPEVKLRKAVWALGLRYRIKSRLPGRPDMVFAKHRVAVFVDGCFWHRCPQHGVAPKSSGAYWRNKLSGNVARDKRVNAALRSEGWKVIRVWEHQVMGGKNPVAGRLAARILRAGRR